MILKMFLKFENLSLDDSYEKDSYKKKCKKGHSLHMFLEICIDNISQVSQSSHVFLMFRLFLGFRFGENRSMFHKKACILLTR